LPRVAAADVELPRVPDAEDVLRDAAHAAAPVLATELLERVAADVVLVGLLALERVVAELEVRHQAAVEEERRAHPRAERDHHLDALALDDAEPLHVGVVRDADRPAELLLERLRELELRPVAVEVRR